VIHNRAGQANAANTENGREPAENLAQVLASHVLGDCVVQQGASRLERRRGSCLLRFSLG
jgi:hypothetical protein